MKNNKKHILIIHPSFCIRAKKQAEALIANSNYSLSIITDVDNKKPQLSDYIKSNANIYSFKFHDNYYHRMKFKWMLKKQFTDIDLIHCHNEPNYHVVDTIKVFSGIKPIVYDIHDLTSMRTGKKCSKEKYSYENSDMIIQVSEQFIDYCNNLYINKPTEVIYSSPSKKNIRTKIISDSQKKYCSFVYQGGIYDPSWNKKTRYSYRNYYPFFKSILKAGHKVDVFTKIDKSRLPSYVELSNQYEKFNLQGHLEYEDLIAKMSEYDFGLAGFNFEKIHSKAAKKYLNAALGNKMFDYLAAGIPVVTFNANAMSSFVVSNNCGLEKIKEIDWKSVINTNFDSKQISQIAIKYCMENQIDKLTEVYKKLINKTKI